MMSYTTSWDTIYRIGQQNAQLRPPTNSGRFLLARPRPLMHKTPALCL